MATQAAAESHSARSSTVEKGSPDRAPLTSTGDQPLKQDRHNGVHHRFTRPHRDAGQMELGISEVVEGRYDSTRQVVASSGLANSQIRLVWEHHRPQLLIALLAEMTGVIFYVYAGGMALATLVLTTAADQPQATLLTVSMCYALGIAFAIIVCAPASGGHFNPCVTIAQVIFKGFPVSLAPLYIIAQIFGGFIASLLIVASYKSQMFEIAALLRMAGKEAQIFSAAGPAGILAIFPPAGKPFGEIFANEFFIDTGLAIVIWAAIDPANPFITPATAPFVVGLAYMSAVNGGAAANALTTNTARGLGTQLGCAVFFGRKCFPARYTALAALTNIVATLLGVSFYTFFLSDSRRPPGPVLLAHMLEEERRNHETMSRGHEEYLERRISNANDRGDDRQAEKLRRLRSKSVSTPQA